MKISIEQMLNAIEDALYILDADGNFLFVNRALSELTGYSERELLHIDAFQLEKRGVTGRSATRTVIDERRPITTCQLIKTKNSNVLQLMMTATPIFDGEALTHIVGVLKNVGEINEKYRDAICKDGIGVAVAAGDGAAHRNIVAESPNMKRTLELASRIAAYDTSVLILGESGSGKEVIADYIHNRSPRSSKNLVKVNCASLPETLLEAELFGYERGAFTGASSAGKIGLIEAAHRGTLFLDEIDSLPLLLQGKLLRVLETKKFMKIGSVKEISSDFRLLTASNADLDTMVANRQFRQDLYFRLNVVPIRIPSLSERSYDIIPLAAHFLEIFCEKYNKSKSFSPEVLEVMSRHHWPGNVREIKNFVERMVVMSSGAIIELADIPKGFFCEFTLRENDFSYIEPLSAPLPDDLFDMENHSYRELIERYENELIRRAMERYQTTYRAAKALRVNQSTIARKNKRFKEMQIYIEEEE